MDHDDKMPKEDEISKPPIRVLDIYNLKDATLAIRELAQNPGSKEAAKKINALNYEIMKGNKAEKMRGLDLWNWTIKLSFLLPQYRAALDRYNIIEENPKNDTIKDQITTLRALINLEVDRQHYPKAWGISTCERHLDAKRTIEEIKRCNLDDYNTILGISPDATKRDVAHAWETRGRLVHPDDAKQIKDAHEAFESKAAKIPYFVGHLLTQKTLELKKAAEAKGVAEVDIDLVVGWNLEEDEDDSESGLVEKFGPLTLSG